MTPIVVLAPTGCLGCRWDSEALKRGMTLEPDVVAVDAGSSDSGPFYLGTGKSLFSKAIYKDQVAELLAAARTARVPLVVGSAGTAGARPHVDKLVEIVWEVAREQGLHFRLARIYADIDKERVKRAIVAGEIKDFEAGFSLTPQLIDETSGLVAQMGYEPIANALSDGAEVVIAGRACDDMVLAAFPILKGGDPALSIHMGKILECGAFASEPFAMDVMLGTLNKDHFVLEPGGLRRRATVRAVAGHALYEREDPFTIAGPGGTVDLRNCRYQQISDRTVRVSGASLQKNDYWVKLEGSKLAGYRTSVILGIRCPTMLARIDDILDEQRKHVANVFSGQEIHVRFLCFGRDAIMGVMEPERNRPVHELGLLIDVAANTQETAHDACNFIALELQHVTYKGQMNNAANVAFPHAPRETDAGPMYEWSAYHLMRVESATELFPINMEAI